MTYIPISEHTPRPTPSSLERVSHMAIILIASILVLVVLAIGAGAAYWASTADDREAQEQNDRAGERIRCQLTGEDC